MPVRYLQRRAIDDAKWNACIDGAANGLIYGYTFYLDAMCPHWDALVLDDYKAVMPLPWRRKGPVYYLYQAFGIAQGGIFGNDISAEMMHGFLKNIPAKFQYWDLPLNFGNRFSVPEFPLFERNNFVLPLHQPHEALQKFYRSFLRRNIKKAEAAGCVFQSDIDLDTIISLVKKQPAHWGTAEDYGHLKKLFEMLCAKSMAQTYCVKSATGAVLAAALFFFSHGRSYYILPGNTTEGKAVGASALLLDGFIKLHAGQLQTLDFEGSDVPGLQFFYSSFSAHNQPYAAIRLNRLPWYLRWLKR